jgi:hypothetical protein
MLDQVTAALHAIQAEGAFATELVCGSDDLRIEVKGVGPLRFPLPARTAEALCAVARLAPFGRRDRTLSDLSVRNTWEVAGSKVKIDARAWARTCGPQLAVLRKRLGLPEDGELKATFDKLLVYGPGQFFAPHQDSERADDMFGSLVVLLPSACSGGALVVQHQGEKKIFRGARRGPRDLSLIAFYADCRHEVRPVKSGYRVVLTYQLHYKAPARAAAPALAPPRIDRLTRAVQAYFDAPQRPDRLVYLLDHEYTQKSLSFGRLKNADRLRVGALLQVADRLGCESYLALADVHENWTCYEDEDWDRGYGRRRWYDDEDDEDDEEAGGEAPEDYELVELNDSSVELRHFVAPDGRALNVIATQPGQSEICFTRASVDMEPFESEYEGYMGNYGNTMDRWYHRAALVMWPRDRDFVIRAKVSPLWAVRELAASLKEGRLDEAREGARSLLPFWARVAPGEQSARFFTSLLTVLARLADAELALGLLSPLGPERLRPGALPGIVALVEAFGLTWAQQLFTAWSSRPRWGAPPWLPLLPDLCRALAGSAGPHGKALASWLLTREVASFKQTREAALRSPVRWSAGREAPPHHDELLSLLESAAVLQDAATRDGLVAFVITPETGLPLMSAGALLRRCRETRTAAGVRALGLQALYEHVVDGLAQVLAAPGRAEDDWSIADPLGCTCALCRELSLFLRDRDRVEHAWPLAKERRRHVHGIIDGHDLPVSHTTVRRGSPFTLVLKKQRALFEREAALRRQQQVLLTWLKKERAAFAGPTPPSRSAT